ncbi:MAG: DUF1285 domain-containing protein [Chrysiogenales bacterium]|nr:MAG: DUF1285 domain-containing protein [Chrysiogenales bacterium]
MTDTYPELPDELREILTRGGSIDEIRLDKNGNWFHNGEPFSNPRIIDFFNRSIDVTRDGIHVIHYGPYTYPIVVEDAPVFVSGVRFKGFGDWEKIILNLSTGVSEPLDVTTLKYRNDTLYCRVHDGRLDARFKHSPFYHIMERLEEDTGGFHLTLCGTKITIIKE